MEENNKAFVVMQVGPKDSHERKRADEIYKYIVMPAVESVGLKSYRSDLDYSPGAITPRFLSELLAARVVIADLTGKNPNVFYELGIAHSFGRPLISLADSAKLLPFDAKDERIIELGEYPATGLPIAQGTEARELLQTSLGIVLDEGYEPPTPLRGAVANLSIDRLAPEDAKAAELAQIRATLEDVRKVITSSQLLPRSVQKEVYALRKVIETNLSFLNEADFDLLSGAETSPTHREWAGDLRRKWSEMKQDPWSSDQARKEDPWAPNAGGYSDEPPF
jgi:hypothetical protein